MNANEQRRVMILTEVVGGTMALAEAAACMAVSQRHAKRVLAAFRRAGVAAVVHGNRGRQPAHTLPPAMRQQIHTLATQKYVGFNQQHLTEQLATNEGLVVSRSSVRRILADAGIGSPRTRRAPKHRSRRERYPQAGMLVQIDASPHDWLEGRGERLTAFAAIDDATGMLLALLFRTEEDAHGYFLLVEQIVTTYGRPLALYHDRHSIFQVNAAETVHEQLTSVRARTQFGRLADELGIGTITAHSPQAKGRVERLFGTLQDRLTSVLRLAGATTLAQATACLADFRAGYNARFAVPAADAGSSFRPSDADVALETLFCFKYRRTVAMDNTVRLGEHRIQLLPGLRRRSWARATVEIQERLDGSLAVWYHGECLATTPAPLEAPVLRTRGGRRGVAAPGESPVPDAPRPPLRRERVIRRVGEGKPGPQHPWKRGVPQRGDKITEQLG